MSSLSSFDDLLSELDAPSAEKPLEDPLRGECLRRLVEASKQIEKIAQTLDPSEKKHPLFGQTVPGPERAQLKDLVGQLMEKQKELQELEETLLAPPAETANPLSHSAPDPSIDAGGNYPEMPAEAPISASIEPVPPPVIPVRHAEPDPERVAFDAYKQQWETVFADDPAQRLAHPEVAAYYQQMEAYFKAKEAHAASVAT